MREQSGENVGKYTSHIEYFNRRHSNKSINLAIIGDGYSKAELDQFHFDSGVAVQLILATAPFSGLQLCVARIDTTSKESSAYRSAGAKVDTFLGVSVDKGNPHLLWINEKRVMAVARAALPTHWFEYKIVVLVNTPEILGGGGKFLPSSGGRASGIAVASNASGSETLMHELGHAFGLADEYADSPLMGESPPNIAMSPDKLPKFWRERLTPNVKRPTIGNDREVVGAFEVRGQPSHFRPQYSCIMKSSSSLDRYCKVCVDWIETSAMTMIPKRKAA
jgi:hypothetical protein